MRAELPAAPRTAVREVRIEADRAVGVRVQGPDGESEVAARLVVGADGRASVVRKAVPGRARTRENPMDIVWCKLPWPEGVPRRDLRAYIGGGHLLIAFEAPDGLLQVAWVILKGTYGDLRARGVEEWVREMRHHVDPELAEHLARHGTDIRKPFLLDVHTDRVEGWSAPGRLLLGDAAHVMSPVGGQGLNLALRDAVVAANHLAPVLADPTATPEAIDEAAGRIEPERGPEIDTVQRLAALPPKLLLRRGPVFDLARRVASHVIASPFVQRRATPGRPRVLRRRDGRLARRLGLVADRVGA